MKDRPMGMGDGTRKYIAAGRSLAIIEGMRSDRNRAHAERVAWAKSMGCRHDSYMGTDHKVMGLPWRKGRKIPEGWAENRRIASEVKGCIVITPLPRSGPGRAANASMNALAPMPDYMDFTNRLAGILPSRGFSCTMENKLRWTYWESLFEALGPDRPAMYIIHVPVGANGVPPDAVPDAVPLPNSAYHAMCETAIRDPGQALEEVAEQFRLSRRKP